MSNCVGNYSCWDFLCCQCLCSQSYIINKETEIEFLNTYISNYWNSFVNYGGLYTPETSTN